MLAKIVRDPACGYYRFSLYLSVLSLFEFSRGKDAHPKDMEDEREK